MLCRWSLSPNETCRTKYSDACLDCAENSFGRVLPRAMVRAEYHTPRASRVPPIKSRRNVPSRASSRAITCSIAMKEARIYLD
jgi:hypothetical protein